jgi:nucleotide-binding universal stress UspA family protein
MKVLVAYDGTLHAQTALQYGMEKVQENGGELIVLHVFNSTLFFDYDAIPGAVEIARRESSRHVEEAEKILRRAGNGVKASIILEEGNPEREIIQYAKDENIDLLLCPTRYKTVAKTFKRMLNEKALETSIYAYGLSPFSTIPISR